MSKKINTSLILIIILFFQSLFYAQKNTEKIWFNGQARSYFARDVLSEINDTLSPRNNSSGYNLLDLNTLA